MLLAFPLAYLLAFPLSSTLVHAAALPKSVVPVVPPVGTTTLSPWRVGVKDTDVSYRNGYKSSYSLELTLPNGTAVPAGLSTPGVSDDTFVAQGCPTCGVTTFDLPPGAQNMSGEFLLTATVTYGVGAGGECAVRFSYQTQTVPATFTIKPASLYDSSGDGSGRLASLVPTTVTFASAPSGTFVATSAARPHTVPNSALPVVAALLTLALGAPVLLLKKKTCTND